MALRPKIDVDLLLALCAFEDAWGHDAHDDRLHNLFGITQAGGDSANAQLAKTARRRHYTAELISAPAFEHRDRAAFRRLLATFRFVPRA